MSIKRDNERIPETTFNAKYSKVQTNETPGGHVVTYDDTDGAKRYRLAHPSGTYTEISDDGKVVQVNVANRHVYDKGGLTLTIQENGDIKIGGHARISVGDGAHVEVGGDAMVAVGGDVVMHAHGNIKAGAQDVYIGARGNMDLNCSGNFNLLVGGTTNIESDGNMTQKAPRIDLNK
jgi:hypothetical protein